MSSILDKIKTIVKGGAHDLLDRAIDMNSPSALRQYVRDLEDALESMRNEAAIQAGQVRTLERESQDLQRNIDTESAAVKKILDNANPTTNSLARSKAENIVNWKKALADKQVALEAQKKTSADLDIAVSKVDLKHKQMLAQVHELERIDRDSKAKEQTAHALEQAGKIVGNGSDISVDDIKSKMMQRQDVASEKFDRAMGSVQVEEDATTASDVDELLSSLQEHK